MRGLVISPEYTLTPNGIQISSTTIDSNKLRQYLMYWDKLDYPNNNIISFGDTPEISYLKSVGVLKSSKIHIHSSGEIGELYAKSQLEAFNLNNSKEKGSWSLAQSNKNLILNRDASELTRSLEIELYKSLPVPSSEVSLEDILVFKEKRNDELLEFRSLMDKLYLEILDSGDPDRAKEKSIKEIQRKIFELNRLMDEAKMNKILGNLKVEVDISGMASKTMGAIGMATVFDFPIAVSAALGFASSFIKVKSELVFKPKDIPPELKDYAYLYYSNKL